MNLRDTDERDLLRAFGIGPSAVPDPREPASQIDDDSPRALAIGQNGNTGEHYEELKP